MEIVCKNCGTVNNDKNGMCMRCGNELNSVNIKSYEKILGKIISEKWLAFFYATTLIVYLYFLISYCAPWLNELIFGFKNHYVFEFYNNMTLTTILLNSIYVVCLFLINYFVFSLFLITITNNRIIKREKVSTFCFLVYLLLIIATISITWIKVKFDYLLMFEHLISVMIIFPYIKRKITKKSI